MNRTCGECVACCKILGIDELQKPPSTWCPHCEIAKGCGIYPDRPQSCRSFRCLWLDQELQPDDMRPDKTKVVLSLQKDTGRLQVNVDPDRPDAWRDGMVGAYIRLAINAGTDVVIVCGDKKKLRAAYTSGDVIQGE